MLEKDDLIWMQPTITAKAQIKQTREELGSGKQHWKAVTAHGGDSQHVCWNMGGRLAPSVGPSCS